MHIRYNSIYKKIQIFIAILFIICLTTSCIRHEEEGLPIYYAEMKITINNLTDIEIDNLYISSTSVKDFYKFDTLNKGDSITVDLSIPYVVEGAVLLNYKDNEEVEQSAILIGYIMPESYTILIDIIGISDKGVYELEYKEK